MSILFALSLLLIMLPNEEVIDEPQDIIYPSEPEGQTGAVSSRRLSDLSEGSEPGFIENKGQIQHPEVLYYTQGPGLSIGFCTGSVIYNLRGDLGKGVNVLVSFEGCDPLTPVGARALDRHLSAFIGNEPERWVRNAPVFREVHYNDLWPGIDMLYYFTDGHIKYDLVVHPNAEPGNIVLAYTGIEGLEVDPRTEELVIRTAAEDIKEQPVLAYQTVDDAICTVPCSFKLTGRDRLSFELGAYDGGRDLIIDPGLEYSTYIGGGAVDLCYAIELDSNGSIYLAGTTNSTDFPTTTGAYNTSKAGRFDIFVMKLASNRTVAWSTFVGGSGTDGGTDIHVDPAGCVYVGGFTNDTDFPTTSGANKTSITGRFQHGFIFKLNSTGSDLIYSTYVGGSGSDSVRDLYVDAQGNCYATGTTNSSEFYISPGAYLNKLKGVHDSFVIKLNASGSSLIYSTFFGGRLTDNSDCIGVDSHGNVVIAGSSNSDDLPTSAGAYDTTYNKHSQWFRLDGFVTKFDPNLTKLEFCTYIGSVELDWIGKMVIDASDDIYMTGETWGSFPTTQDAYSRWSYPKDAFVCKLSHNGSDLLHSTTLGEYGEEIGRDIHVDSQACVWIVGTTTSAKFPMTPDANDTTYAPNGDGFIVRFNETLSTLLYSSFFGGNSLEFPRSLDVLNGSVYATGETYSSDFFTTPGALRTSFEGGREGFLVITKDLEDVVVNDRSPGTATLGGSYTFNMSISDNAGVNLVSITYWYDDEATAVTTTLPRSSGTTMDGIYILTIPVPLESATLSYEVNATDVTGNILVTPTRDVPAVDDRLPTFNNLGHTPTVATTGEVLNISVNVTDNVAVDNVRVVTWFGNDIANATNNTMTSVDPSAPKGDGVHFHLLPVPHELATIHYRLWTNDTSGNWNESAEVDVSVIDNDDPTFGTDSTATTATTGDPFTFSVEVNDNVAVKGTWVLYRYGSGTTFNGTLTSSNGVLWQFVVTVDDTLEGLTYTFGTEDTSGNMNTHPGGAVSVTDNDPPVFEENLSDANGTTGDPCRFAVNVSDNVDISKEAVFLNYAFDRGPYTNISMNWKVTPGPYWGIAEFYVDMPMYTLSRVAYYFTMKDEAGNWNTSSSYSFTVVDNDQPLFGMDTSDGFGTTGELFTLEIEVEDNIGVGTVHVVYWLEGGPSTNDTMVGINVNGVGNGTYQYASFVVPLDSRASNISYYFVSSDEAGNWNNTTVSTVSVFDNDAPMVLSDDSDAVGTTGEIFHALVNVSDNLGVMSVHLIYWIGNEPTPHINETMTGIDISGIGNGSYSFDLLILSNERGPINYHFDILDISGIWNRTSVVTTSVLDNDKPSFGEDASPDTADTDLLYEFSIPVWDNIEVAEVWAEYRYGEGEGTRLNLTSTTGTTWEGSMIVEATLEDLHYVIWSNDTSGNSNSTLERTVDVIDINGPGIINEGTKSWATTGDPHEFTLTAHDNVGLKGATLWYAFDDGELASIEMEVVEAYPSSGNVLYSIVIDVPSDQVANITYSYEIEDLYGNVLLTHVDIVRVRDNDAPSMVEDLSDATATTGEVFHARIRVRDNIGIDIVSSGEELWTGTDIDDQGNGIYELGVQMDNDYVGAFYLFVGLLDLAGNEVTYELVTPIIVDNDLPELEHAHGELIVPKGQDCELHVTVRDNIGMGKVSISYRFGEGTEESSPMERTPSGGDTYWEVMIPVPREIEGPLFYRFTAEDASGNANATEWFEGACVNRPPELKSDPPDWYVTEEATATLDLTDHVVDGNDPPTALTAACDAPGIIVSGLVLQTRYDEWVPEHRLEVRVTDGEDTLWFNVTVRVTNVNDAPVIISMSPENGSKFKQGKMVTFTVEATDEDGDDLTMTWTSDGVTIGTGDTLDYKKLKPGTRKIKVTVSDGEASVEDEFTVVIQKEEESPTLGGAFVLLAMLVGMATLMMRRKGESDCPD